MPLDTTGQTAEAPAPPADYGIGAARAEGYSDAEIASYLAKNSSLAIGDARKADYTDTEILDHLSPGSIRKAAPTSPTEIAADQNSAGSGIADAARTMGGDIMGAGRAVAGGAASMPALDDYGNDVGQPAPGQAAVNRIGRAAAEGWQSSGFQTPEVADKNAVENDQTLVGKYLINPAVSLSNVPFRAMGAVGGALSQSAVEAGAAVGRPELGRDLNMLAQVAPVAHVPGTAPVAGLRQALMRDPIAAIGAATDVDGVVAAAGRAVGTPAEAAGEALAPVEPPQLRLLRQTESAILRRVDGDETRLTDVESRRLDTLRSQMAEMQGPAEDIPTVTVTAPAPGAAELAPETPMGRTVAADEGAPVAPAEAPGPVVAPEPAASNALVDADPLSVGAAATSRDTTGLTMFGRSARELKGQAADMELADLMRTPQPNDARDIIPGATQTRAEIELNPTVSRAAKGLRQEFRDGFNDHEKANNEIYHAWVDELVPPREQIATAKDLRKARWQEAERSVFGPKAEGEIVNSEPAVQHILDLFADPIEKHNSYLRSAFQPFFDRLTDDNGAPIDIGARELYGIRQEMGRKVRDMATNTDLAHVRGQFAELMGVMDNAISSAAPDYRSMMDEYRVRSMAIDAAERLQDLSLKIATGPDRVITFGALDRYMKSLWMERHGPNPQAPAKSIPQDTWDKLMMLHERLARSASDQELARTRGSDTTQLMMQMLRTGAIGAAHTVVGALTHGAGNVAIPFVSKQISRGLSARQVRQELNPDLSRYPTPGP